MDYGKGTKIFSLFDALKGFSEAIAAKKVLYKFKRELSYYEKEELNRKLTILHDLTYNSRIARQNKVRITVTYYVPCTDKDNFSYGYMGQYTSLTGIVRNVDTVLSHSIMIDNQEISFSDILDIESDRATNDRNIFDNPWEENAS